MSVDDRLVKMQDQEEASEAVGAVEGGNEQSQVSKGKEVRMIKEEIQLEGDEEDEGDEILGDMDDLLAGLPDDTEVMKCSNTYSMILSI
jgi:hypothetical protein